MVNKFKLGEAVKVVYDARWYGGIVKFGSLGVITQLPDPLASHPYEREHYHILSNGYDCEGPEYYFELIVDIPEVIKIKNSKLLKWIKS